MSRAIKDNPSQTIPGLGQTSRFIRNGRKPQVKYSTLSISKERGGNLPNRKDYYYSALLKTIVL